MQPPTGSLLDSTPPPARRPKLWTTGTLVYSTAGLALLFCWLLFGDFAWQLKERSVTATAQLVLRKFAASDFLVGLLIGSLPAALAMVLAPIISVKSDRHRGRWGRRIPFLLLPLPFVVLSMAGLAIAPSVGVHVHEWLGGRSPGQNICILSVFALLWTAFEFSSIIANSVFGGLINDIVPKEVIGRFFGLFRTVSLIDGIIFNTFIIKRAEDYFSWIFLGTGLFYGIGFGLMCVMVKEGEYPPVKAQEGSAIPGRMQVLRSYMRECFATPYYLWVFMALILCNLAFAPVNNFSVFYAKSLGMNMELYGRYIAASYVCSLGLAFFIGWLADRLHPLRLGIASISLYALVALFGAAFGTNPQNFGFAFMAHTVISGLYMTSMASAGMRLFPKLKFAQFTSASGILGGVCGAVLPPAMGLILDSSHHNYRLTFLASGALSILGLICLLVVHHQFLLLGGPDNYVAPHSIDPSQDTF